MRKVEGENAQCRKRKVGKALFFGRQHEGKSRQPTTNLGDLSEKHRKLEGASETETINLKKLQLKDGDCSYERSRSGSEQC